ncbi:MAG: shikimate dehydrogenase [Nitrososphaerota archaeon]|nr:shikimate dehydrogenase [Aigarchaeota archaeon]MDW8076614.1 shikimate dehydrogenase [Nitrososphaerota archaeon]
MRFGNKKLVGLIGHPVKHSISPDIHNAAFNYMNIDYFYNAFDVEKNALGYAVKGLKALGAVGFNVTIPYKQKVVKFLDKLVDDAKIIKTVNTVVIKKDRMLGYNTDILGVIKALMPYKDLLSGCEALILGSGGGASAAALALFRLGCNRITFANRTPSKARKLASFLKRRVKISVEGTSLSVNSLSKVTKTCSVIINATPVGMWPNKDHSLLKKEQIRSGSIVMDMVYNPPETLLLKEAKQAGAICVSGLEMLLFQAAESFKLWTSLDPPIEVMKNVAMEAIGRFT